MSRAKSIAIWTCGIVAAALIGGAIGESLSGPTGALPGWVGGLCAFVCARLWMTELRS